MQKPTVQRRRRERASTSRTPPAGLAPSYASPTISSKAKSLPESPPPSPTTPSKLQSHSPPQRDFKTFSLSTKASRQRSRFLGPFRFLDLPADIRNIIYEYIFTEKPTTYVRYASKTARSYSEIDLAGRYPRLESEPLPALLRVPNKQIRYELGSYVFNHYKLVLAAMDLRAIATVLRLIGYENCQRLVATQTKQPDLHILQLWDKCGCEYGRTAHMWVSDGIFANWSEISTLVDIDTLWRYKPREGGGDGNLASSVTKA